MSKTIRLISKLGLKGIAKKKLFNLYKALPWNKREPFNSNLRLIIKQHNDTLQKSKPRKCTRGN
jgi:hypothetical protein